MYKLSLLSIISLLLFTSCDDILNWLDSKKNSSDYDEYRITSISYYGGNNTFESMKQILFYSDSLLQYQYHIYRNSNGEITDTTEVKYGYLNNEVTEEFSYKGLVHSKNIYQVEGDLLLSMEQSYLRNNQWHNENKYVHTYLNDTLRESKTYVSVLNTFQFNSKIEFDFFRNNKSKWNVYNDINELTSQYIYYHNNETLDSMVLYIPNASNTMMPTLKEIYTFNGNRLSEIKRWSMVSNQWTNYNTTTFEYDDMGLLKESIISNSSNSEKTTYTWEKGASNYSTLKIDPAIRQTGISTLKGEVPK